MLPKRTRIRIGLIGATFVVLGFAYSAPAHAQTWTAHLGAGFSSATFTGESNNVFTARNAFAGGGGATLNVNDVIGVRSEVIYAVRGAVADNAVIDGEPTQLTARFSIAYVDVPLMIVARLPLSFSVSPYVFGGAALSRNVDARLTLISPTGDEVTDGDSSIGKNEFSVIGGLGVQFAVATEVVFIEGRFMEGLQNVRPDRPDAPLNNRSFLVVAGVRF